MKAATVTLFFDQRRGHNSIKFLVTFERKQKLYATGFTTDPETWERLKKQAGKDKPDGKIKDEEFIQLWASLWNDPDKFDKKQRLGIVLVARQIANQLGANFDFDTFKDLYDNWGKDRKVEAEKTDLLKALSTKSETLLKNGQVSHGTNFGALGKSLQRFIHTLTKSECKEYGLAVGNVRNPQPLTLEYRHVTPDFLKHYEEWMLHEGKPRKAPKANPQA